MNKQGSLVTGGSGTVGAYIVRRLDELGHTVTAMSRTVAMPQRLDNLILMHGVAEMSPFLLQSEEAERKIFEANYFFTTKVIRLAARKMIAQKHGNIVTCSTVAVPLALEGESSYSASKAAVEQLTKVLAKEFAPFNISVNCVAPGPILGSPMIERVPVKVLDKLYEKLTTHRPTTLDEVWATVKFLVESTGITGEIIRLGGV